MLNRAEGSQADFAQLERKPYLYCLLALIPALPERGMHCIVLLRRLRRLRRQQSDAGLRGQLVHERRRQSDLLIRRQQLLLQLCVLVGHCTAAQHRAVSALARYGAICAH